MLVHETVVLHDYDSKDPSGNNLEFKSMTVPEYLFERYNVVD